jgi:hypothetical protein
MLACLNFLRLVWLGRGAPRPYNFAINLSFCVFFELFGFSEQLRRKSFNKSITQ